jgi:hypothetical protein
LIEQDDPIGDRHRLVDQLLDQQDAHALLSEPGQGREDVFDDRWREACAGLVQHDHARLGHQGLRYRQHLLLAATEAAGEQVSPVQEDGELVIGSMQRLLPFCPPHDVAPYQEVLLDRPPPEDALVLADESETHLGPKASRPSGDILAAEFHSPPQPPQHARDGEQRRALSGAVPSQQHGDLTGFDREVDVPDRLEVSVAS